MKIPFISNYLEQRKQRIYTSDYIRGFNWAAGQLLRQEETPESIEASLWRLNHDAFDIGILDATRAFTKLEICYS